MNRNLLDQSSGDCGHCLLFTVYTSKLRRAVYCLLFTVYCLLFTLHCKWVTYLVLIPKQQFWVNDPAQSTAPLVVSLDGLLAAWREFDYQGAVVQVMPQKRSGLSRALAWLWRRLKAKRVKGTGDR